jgi:aminoglycoside phosphotransferase (APT) family kinase protein
VTHLPAAITESLVRRLVEEQFPQWAHLPIRPVSRSGWDNRMFRLGDEMVVRLPSGPAYALAIEREQRWLQYLAPQLPLCVPEPIASGEPHADYPRSWSIYRWIVGDSLHDTEGVDLVTLGREIGEFLSALHAIDATGGPNPGPQNFYRGGSLSVYAEQTAQAIDALGDKVDGHLVQKLWRRAMESSWDRKPLWVHGDMSAGNLLVKDGKLCGVIDFGQLAVGDPACDLTIAWTTFSGESRDAFREAIPLDSETWVRGRGWSLWKALIVAAELVQSTAVASDRCWRTIREVLADHAAWEG